MDGVSFWPANCGALEESMGELDADIREFEEYTRVVSANDISDTKWGKAARIPQPRIAELRRILRLMDEESLTQEQASKRIRRECTHMKLNKLYRGLCAILGEDYMKQALERAIKQGRNPRLRAQYLVRGLDDDLIPEAIGMLRKLHAKSERIKEEKAKKRKK